MLTQGTHKTHDTHDTQHTQPHVLIWLEMLTQGTHKTHDTQDTRHTTWSKETPPPGGVSFDQSSCLNMSKDVDTRHTQYVMLTHMLTHGHDMLTQGTHNMSRYVDTRTCLEMLTQGTHKTHDTQDTWHTRHTRHDIQDTQGHTTHTTHDTHNTQDTTYKTDKETWGVWIFTPAIYPRRRRGGLG